MFDHVISTICDHYDMCLWVPCSPLCSHLINDQSLVGLMLGLFIYPILGWVVMTKHKGYASTAIVFDELVEYHRCAAGQRIGHVDCFSCLSLMMSSSQEVSAVCLNKW